MDVLAFLPLFTETLDTVRARMDADVNAGLDPEDGRFLDTTEGGFYWDLTHPGALESERAYDAMGTIYAAALFPLFAWGTYLDYHGETYGLPRREATKAIGAVTFAGDPGASIAVGTQVGTAAPSPDADPIVFVVTESVVLATTPAPSGLTATAAATGTLPLGTYFYAVTAELPAGESVASVEASVVVGAGQGRVNLSWSTVAGATGYKVYRGSVSGQWSLLADLGVVLTHADTGAVTPGPTKPPTNNAPVEADEAGAEGNVAAGSVTQLLSALGDDVTAVANLSAMTGGSDDEADDSYRDRILQTLSASQGSGTVADYKRWAREYNPAAVGNVTVEPLWSGPGTVRVVITDGANRPVSAAVVAGLKAVLDPVAGQGAGKAPIGAAVTVTTPTTLLVDVVATVVPEAGYSVAGTGGLIGLTADITAALKGYIDTLAPGGDVVLMEVAAAIVSVRGVYDVSGVTLNGTAATLAVSATQVAQTDDVTLT